jgi:hypothetical protein
VEEILAGLGASGELAALFTAHGVTYEKPVAG